MKEDKIRTFIALSFPKMLIEGIAELQGRLKALEMAQVRWVRPENIHLTLKFIGDIEPERVDPITEAIAAAVSGYAPLVLRAEGIGVFPNIRRPKVIWTGIGGQNESLLCLQKEVEDNLAAIGFEKGKRPFKSHLTLGRFKGTCDEAQLSRGMQDNVQFQSEMSTIDHIVFYKSILRPAGPTYIQLKTFEMR